MNGPFCTSCGAPVPGARFCTSCGAQVVAPEPDPYEYLFAETQPEAASKASESAASFDDEDFATLERTAIRPGRPPAPPTGPPPGWRPTAAAQRPARRRAFGWPWVVAAALVLATIVGIGMSLTLGHRSTVSARQQVAPTTAGPTHAAQRSRTGARSAAPAPTGPHSPARVAARVSGLLAAEVAAHRGDSAAVGALRSCRDVARNRRTIASFASTRLQLGRRLAAVPASSDRRLDSVVHRLLLTWRSLATVDRSYTRWAQGVRRSRHTCHAGPAPTTSPALQVQRRRLRADWVAVLDAHPSWGVRPVAALQRGGLAFLLL